MVRSYEETSKLILDFLKKNSDKTINQISLETGIDYRTTWRHIHDLEKAGKIKVQEIAGAKIINLVEKDAQR